MPAKTDDPKREALRTMWEALATAVTSGLQAAKHQWPEHRRRFHVGQAFVVAVMVPDEEEVA